MPEFTSQDIETIRKCAQRLVDIINESKELALTSNDPAIKISRLRLAQDTLKELKEMAHQYPFLKLLTLDEFEVELSEIALKIQLSGYAAIADANEAGQQLEREGSIDEAILKYEEITANAVDTPFPYQRLAVLYKKKKMPLDEIRILEEAIKNIPVSNAKHFKWFEDRYKKILLSQK